MHEVTIRPIRPEDNAALAAIIRHGIESLGLPTEGTAHSDPTTDNLYDLFETPGSLYRVAEQHGKVLGGCGIYPTNGLPEGYCELVRFFLAPEARGRGLGLELMQQSLDRARQLGYTHSYLESFPDMKTAIAIYKRHGFTTLQHPLGNSGHYSCNVWMVKEL